MYLVVAAPRPPSDDATSRVAWSMCARAAQEATTTPTRVMIDSGAGRSVCPPVLAQYTREHGLDDVKILSATGAVIPHDGVAAVTLDCGGERPMVAEFVVALVAQPLLSVAALVDHGFS